MADTPQSSGMAHARHLARQPIAPVPRRTFLRYGLFGSVGTAFGGLGVMSLGLVWPRLGDGLRGEIDIGDAAMLAATIRADRAPLRVPEGGFSIQVWDPSSRAAMRVYGDDHAVLDDETGLMALNTASCPHLGCGVPWCQSSQWFECPCHGSRYNRYGEWTRPPAPRGLDRFASFVADGHYIVDLDRPLTGTARTANVLEQPPEGASCIDA
jgi:cytochrome b6-f complex iron-sulfur subunit